MKKIYQLILVLYLATGIAVSGYFYLYPNYYKIKDKYQLFYGDPTYHYEEGKEFGVSVLATIVGSVLIGGIGFVMLKPK